MKIAAPRIAVLNPAAALDRAAALWLAVTLAGQWAFFYYIARFYGPATLAGHFQAWRRNHNLFKGYVPGDGAGNLVFAAHVLLAASIAFAGALQLVPQIRARAPAIHRWNGRVFLSAAVSASLGGLYMIWVRGAVPNLFGGLSSSLNAALILAFALLAWRAARARAFADHRRWAMRCFMAANGVWFFRLGMFCWIILNGGRTPGMGDNLDGPFDYAWDLGCYLLPLAILELYLRARAGGGPGARLAMAGGLAVVSVLMSIGAIGLYLMIEAPLLAKV